MPAGSSKASGRTGAQHTRSRGRLLVRGTDGHGPVGSVRVVILARGALGCGPAALRAGALFARESPLVQGDDDLLDLASHRFRVPAPIAGDDVRALRYSIHEP